MKIRNAKKEDVQQYVELKRNEEIDYSKIAGRKIRHPSNSILKKDFLNALPSRKERTIFAEEDNKLLGYLQCNFFGKAKNKVAYISFLYVNRDNRRQGIAKKLLSHLSNYVKKRKFKEIILSVNIKNTGALKLYEKEGYTLYKYELKKELR